MKQIIPALFLGAAIMSSIECFSQEIPVPEYPSRPYYLKQDNTLGSLERTDAATDFKVKGMGYGGTELYYAAFGVASGTRFAAGRLPRIFISFENNVDPEESVTLSKAEVKKDRRRFLLSSRSMTGTVRNTETTEVKLEFRKVKAGLFEIIVPTTLEAGEYAFMPMGDQSISITSISNIKISCFGIDGEGGSTKVNTPGTPAQVTQPGSSTTATTPETPQPDFDNVVYQYNTENETLVDLERATNTKSEGTFGFLNFANAVSIKGASSPVQILSAQANFIVRLADGADPYTLIELLPCSVNSAKQTRDFATASKQGEPAKESVALKFKRLTGNTYLVTPLQKLPEGEYFFINKILKEKSVFAFRAR